MVSTGKQKKFTSKHMLWFQFFLVLITCFVLTGCSGYEAAPASKSDIMSVHFIDVGQGDSTLILSEDSSLLIDAGDNKQENTVTKYLKNQGITKLDYVILTHPDADHAGGMDAVIQAFDIGTVIMPPVSHTTKTFEDVLDALADKNLKITKPVIGTSYNLGKGLFTIIAPNGDYGDDLNNWSVGVKVTNGSNSFVLCGDAETEAEHDIIKNGLDLSANVLKLGHHGSSTSSTEEFLDAVSPSFAVISCGKDNSYGHPHEETLEKMEKRQIHLFRTDISGTVIASSDGSQITWNTKGEASADEATTRQTERDKPQGTVDTKYILNTSSKKFHLPSCPSVDDMKGSNKETYYGSREDLTASGYVPCKNCNP